jgi:hypothetical protein
MKLQAPRSDPMTIRVNAHPTPAIVTTADTLTIKEK